MPATGTSLASAPKRAILGPALTQGGFRYWYWACFPDGIVAVRQGAWNGILYGMAGEALPIHLGLLGYLLMALLKKQGVKRRQQVEATIESTPTSRLRANPNIVYDAAQLRSITFKSRTFGTLITPSITLETNDGKKKKFGMQKPDFDKALVQLKQMYPALCNENP